MTKMHESDLTTMFAFANFEDMTGFMFHRLHLHSLLAPWILQISIFHQSAQPDDGSEIRNLNDAASF